MQNDYTLPVKRHSPSSVKIFLRTWSRSGMFWDVDPQHWSVFLNAKWSVMHWYWCILGKVCLISPSNSFRICVLFYTVGGRDWTWDFTETYGIVRTCWTSLFSLCTCRDVMYLLWSLVYLYACLLGFITIITIIFFVLFILLWTLFGIRLDVLQM